jgi:hypothetical protein
MKGGFEHHAAQRTLAARTEAGHGLGMTAGASTAALAASRNAANRLAVRAARHLKTQVEDWHDECRYLADWEDEHLVDDPTPERLAEHARLLDELERIGRWLALATQSADFPDRPTAELVTLTFRSLADCRAMWHGKDLNEKQRAEILKACFNES